MPHQEGNPCYSSASWQTDTRVYYPVLGNYLENGLCAWMGEFAGDFDTEGYESGEQEPAAPLQLDYADVPVLGPVKRALMAAAVGGHNILMIGPAGSGKAALARRFPTILPPLSDKEREQAILIRAAAQADMGDVLSGQRPFRAPHCSISLSGLLGGGRPVCPGELSLAHGGVLFLEDLQDFSGSCLTGLAAALRDQEVRLVRVDGTYRLPAQVQLIAAAPACRCGNFGDPAHDCRCSVTQLAGYQERLGGEARSLFDMEIEVRRPYARQRFADPEGMSSAEMREQVLAAREFRSWRIRRGGLDGDPVRERISFLPDARTRFEREADSFRLSGGDISRAARVARSLADLAGHDHVGIGELVEALAYRGRTKPGHAIRDAEIVDAGELEALEAGSSPARFEEAAARQATSETGHAADAPVIRPSRPAH